MAILTIRNSSCLIPMDCVEYGYLYNPYAYDEPEFGNQITSSSDWRVSTEDDWRNVVGYVGGNWPYPGSIITGGAYALRKTGTDYWDNANGTDSVGLRIVGGGGRDLSGIFQNIGEQARYASVTSYGASMTFNVLSDNPSYANSGYRMGRYVRLVSDATGVSDGTTTVYIGNDGKAYSAIAINGLYWTQSNLAETQYRNGDPIPTVEDATTWAGLTTGAKCAYENNYSYVGCDEVGDELTTYPTIEYGLLYNWYAATDARNITSSATWSVPTQTQLNSLDTYIGTDVSGVKLRETGTTYWNYDDGCTNEYGFNARGAGGRSYNVGTYVLIQEAMLIWSATQLSSSDAYNFRIRRGYDNDVVTFNKKTGYTIRLVSDATGISDGTTTTYTGNDGKVYLAVAINELYWLAENLAETKYRNGDIIPEVTDGINWAGLSTGALCSYENDWTYSGRTKPSYY